MGVALALNCRDSWPVQSAITCQTWTWAGSRHDRLSGPELAGSAVDRPRRLSSHGNRQSIHVSGPRPRTADLPGWRSPTAPGRWRLRSGASPRRGSPPPNRAGELPPRSRGLRRKPRPMANIRVQPARVHPSDATHASKARYSEDVPRPFTRTRRGSSTARSIANVAACFAWLVCISRTSTP